MSFPDVSSAFWNWTEPIVFNVVTTRAVDYEAVDVPENQICFDGVIEPLKPRDLLIKPEGERKFKYWTLWTEQELKPDSIIQDQTGSQYRVTGKSDWRSGDYQQYEIMQTPNPAYSGS